jgi:oligopeptide/dipeptide ABC transporter ATP-binding protein
MAPDVNGSLLRVQDLSVAYHLDSNTTVQALHDVSFDVQPGEIVGIVGESGCGKSTLSSSLLRLLPANGEITSGSALLKGTDILTMSKRDLRSLRGKEIAMIFQDPLTSLNPTFTIGDQMVEAQRAHRRRGEASANALRKRAVEMLGQVGIPDPKERIKDYPHQFSGGMRQRIMIAIALLLEPALLIADEPTSSLDVTLEVQILELLKQLRSRLGTAVIFISHDLGVIAQICDRVAVMYAGRMVEEADVTSIFDIPMHPYTQALLAAVPSRHRRDRRLASIPGRVPSLSALPPGCKFADRCPHCQTVCTQGEPRLVDVMDEPRLHRVRCLIHDPTSGYVHTPEAVS